MAASTGASTKELMSRMGHASPRAALMYQHATSERDRVLADALSRLAEPRHGAPPRLHAVPPIERQYSINVRSGHSAALEDDPLRRAKVLVKLVETSGLEPPTPCVQSRCSSQLSYVPRLVAPETTLAEYRRSQPGGEPLRPRVGTGGRRSGEVPPAKQAQCWCGALRAMSSGRVGVGGPMPGVRCRPGPGLADRRGPASAPRPSSPPLCRYSGYRIQPPRRRTSRRVLGVVLAILVATAVIVGLVVGIGQEPARPKAGAAGARPRPRPRQLYRHLHGPARGGNRAP